MEEHAWNSKKNLSSGCKAVFCCPLWFKVLSLFFYVAPVTAPGVHLSISCEMANILLEVGEAKAR